MNNYRDRQIEIEPHFRNVLEIFPKTREFGGKPENHVPPHVAEIGATSTKVKMSSDLSENIAALPRTFARTKNP
jgi:hypothetical protein